MLKVPPAPTLRWQEKPAAVRLLIQYDADAQLSPSVDKLRPDSVGLGEQFGSNPATRAECEALVRNAEKIRVDVQRDRAAAAAAERLQKERDHQAAKQRELAKWLASNCGLNQTASERAAANLGAEGFNFDSVEKLETLVELGEKGTEALLHRSLAACMPCGRVRHVRKRARAGDWPPNIDAATRFSIVYAFKKAKGPSVNESSAPTAAPAPAPANASSPHEISAKQFGAGASNAQSVSPSAAAPSASKLAPLLEDICDVSTEVAATYAGVLASWVRRASSVASVCVTVAPSLLVLRFM